MKRVLLLASVVCLSGCLRRETRPEEAEEDPMREKLAPWVGHNIHEAIEELGPPTQRYENGPTVLYLWRHVGPSSAIGVGLGAVGLGRAWTSVCDVTLITDQAETVIKWRWQGRC